MILTFYARLQEKLLQQARWEIHVEGSRYLPTAALLFLFSSFFLHAQHRLTRTRGAAGSAFLCAPPGPLRRPPPRPGRALPPRSSRRPRAPGQPHGSAPAAPASPGAGHGAPRTGTWPSFHPTPPPPLRGGDPGRPNPAQAVPRRGWAGEPARPACPGRSGGKARGNRAPNPATSTGARVSSTFCRQPLHCGNSSAGQRAAFPEGAVFPKSEGI